MDTRMCNALLLVWESLRVVSLDNWNHLSRDKCLNYATCNIPLRRSFFFFFLPFTSLYKQLYTIKPNTESII